MIMEEKNLKQSNAEAFELRPHHGMCIAFFEGKGYSNEFQDQMGRMCDVFLKEDPMIRLVLHCDDTICIACPNNHHNFCITEQKVCSYDNQVLQLCGLKEGDLLSFSTLARLVQEKIIDANKRKRICGSCQWNEICSSKKSQYHI